MKINQERLQQHFEEMSEIGKIGETGICRPSQSSIEKQAFELARSWMEEAGMTVRIDHFGNLIGRLEGKDQTKPVLMLGSHLDSQPYGGRFDGVAGVLAAIEVVTTLTEQGMTPENPIEVVSFSDEEGWRFNKGLFGVRGILGQLEEGELLRKDKDGITREQALIDFGCDPNKFDESVYPQNSIAAFLELHIEQGPILEEKDQPIGIVSAISGPLWLTVRLTGFAGHAGSVPMAIRQDALVGAAEIIVALNEIAKQDPSAPTVSTVGTIDVFPNSRNIIPEKVEFTVDLRDIDINRRDLYETQLRERIQKVADKHQLTYEIIEDTKSEPRFCADWIKDIIRNECKEKGLEAPELMSGPFHDSLAMSYACDYGMIFIRCKDGISHNPAEYASYDDLAKGTDIMFGTVLKMIKQLQPSLTT
ncbi:M20 family metallo-hydrolase [Metabacillus herbersteinensis]|uniref:M20 family metallo-hydrolase n=1 Tax=Metabacillus herbersteinensis TaxID=283816 RepID=A0ABV6GIN5_9BACI